MERPWEPFKGMGSLEYFVKLGFDNGQPSMGCEGVHRNATVAQTAFWAEGIWIPDIP